jgi:hypothetical protein
MDRIAVHHSDAGDTLPRSPVSEDQNARRRNAPSREWHFFDGRFMFRGDSVRSAFQVVEEQQSQKPDNNDAQRYWPQVRHLEDVKAAERVGPKLGMRANNPMLFPHPAAARQYSSGKQTQGTRKKPRRSFLCIQRKRPNPNLAFVLLFPTPLCASATTTRLDGSSLL